MILEQWLEKIKTSQNNIELVKNCGIYNDMFFFMQTDSLQELFNIILDYGFKYAEKKQIENYYKTDLIDQYAFFKDNYQLLIRVPNKGVTFSTYSCYSLKCKDNEINFKYDLEIQFSIFSTAVNMKPVIIDICENFIIKNKVKSLIATVNCKNQKFSFFSNFINDWNWFLIIFML